MVVSGLKKVGGKFTKIKGKTKEMASKVKYLVRCSHLFAKGKESKAKVGKKIYHQAKAIQSLLQECLIEGRAVHGKAGKSVEFGLKWGISRVDGFVIEFLMEQMSNVSAKKFCLEAIQKHVELFGQAPEIYGFDRGGYNAGNIKKAQAMGVKHVGIAPAGKADWAVSEKMSERISRERAQVEGVIGAVKSKKYGFNKPNVKSTPAMEMSGHRSFLGFNLCKALRKLDQQALQMA